MNSLTESVQEQSRLFFVLSGEHASLPAAEVRAILDSEKFEFREPEQSYRLLALTCSVRALTTIAERSLMYDSCGVLLGECDGDEAQIQALVKSQPIETLARNAETFAVRSVRLGGVNRSIRREDLERRLGALVKELAPRLRVRLQNPDLIFACILFEDKFVFGVSGFSKQSGLIAPRRPRQRPVFHPSTMPPKIARCMVNLARATPGAIFADPFCGVGGIAIEAAVIGSRVVALDASLRTLRGARRNMKHFGLDAEGFLNSDARNLPVQSLDAIATDPPYGRGSSTMGAKVPNLVREFLAGARGSLKKKAHLCISAPEEIEVEAYAREAGLTMKERHLAKIHRSLTRQFVVLQNS